MVATQILMAKKIVQSNYHVSCSEVYYGYQIHFPFNSTENVHGTTVLYT